MLELLLLLCLALALVTLCIYVKLQKRVNQKYPSLRQKPNATAFEKWRDNQHVAYLLSEYSQQPYRQVIAVGRWIMAIFICLGGSLASFFVADFVNWSAFIFPIGVLISSIGLMRAQRRALMVQLPAWQAFIAHDPYQAASLGMTEADLPQLKRRITKLMNLYWLWLVVIGLIVGVLLIAIYTKF